MGKGNTTGKVNYTKRKEMREARRELHLLGESPEKQLYSYNGQLVEWSKLPPSRQKQYKRGPSATSPPLRGSAAGRAQLPKPLAGGPSGRKRSRKAVYAGPPLTAYEEERERNIKENERKLAELFGGVGVAALPPRVGCGGEEAEPKVTVMAEAEDPPSSKGSWVGLDDNFWENLPDITDESSCLQVLELLLE